MVKIDVSYDEALTLSKGEIGGSGGDISVEEDYTISEGVLTAASVELIGDVVGNIPEGVSILGGGAFQYNHFISKIIMPNSVVTIEDGAPWLDGKGCFNQCERLREITLSSALTKIGSFAFYFCSGLQSIIIPDSVTSIGNNAFDNCDGLTSFIIPDSVTSIGNNTFANCDGLTSFIIPDSVTSIGSDAFIGCTALTDIYYTGTQTQWENITGLTGAGIPAGCTIHYESEVI